MSKKLETCVFNKMIELERIKGFDERCRKINSQSILSQAFQLASINFESTEACSDGIKNAHENSFV